MHVLCLLPPYHASAYAAAWLHHRCMAMTTAGQLADPFPSSLYRRGTHVGEYRLRLRTVVRRRLGLGPRPRVGARCDGLGWKGAEISCKCASVRVRAGVTVRRLISGLASGQRTRRTRVVHSQKKDPIVRRTWTDRSINAAGRIAVSWHPIRQRTSRRRWTLEKRGPID